MCEKQSKCRDEARILVEQMKDIYFLKERIAVIHERTETKRTVDLVLDVVRKICDYILEKTSNGILG